MGDNNPFEIGGRDTDITQLYFSLNRLVKDAYPINSVPPEIMVIVDRCRDVCDLAEAAVKDAIQVDFFPLDFFKPQQD